MIEAVVVSFPSTGINAAIPSVSLWYLIPPKGDNTVPLPIEESNLSINPFWEATLNLDNVLVTN